MNTLIVLGLLICTFATGHAITCVKCMETSSDDPNFQPPSDPNAATCSSNPGEMECPAEISSCMTMVMHMHFTRDSGPLILTQTLRDCGPPANSGLPSGDTCVAEQTAIDAMTSGMPAPSEMFPPELGLTYESIDATICLCDSSDKCTPPSPSVEATSEPEPAAGDAGNAQAAESTMKPTTPSGAVSLVSSFALVLGSLINVFICRAL